MTITQAKLTELKERVASEVDKIGKRSVDFIYTYISILIDKAYLLGREEEARRSLEKSALEQDAYYEKHPEEITPKELLKTEKEKEVKI